MERRRLSRARRDPWRNERARSQGWPSFKTSSCCNRGEAPRPLAGTGSLQPSFGEDLCATNSSCLDVGSPVAFAGDVFLMSEARPPGVGAASIEAEHVDPDNAAVFMLCMQA